MKKIKIIAGIAWAFAGLILIIILFPGLNSFSDSASRLPFMKINPNYSGGEIVKELTSEGCTLSVHRPVFDGLFRERKTGFVQIDWRGNLTDIISDTIDYDLDNKADFRILIDRQNTKTSLDVFNKKVKEVTLSTSTSYGWSARIDLLK